ncbi:MAG: hypothetical protein R3B40_27885 [Polyangiales bacterium]|nr:hypothetical protein [Myxococcales bacterium]MCB9656728.1 hypothetical protein [Sandaracinaceae bacterium]
MIRACVVALSCWVAAAVYGLLGAPPHGLQAPDIRSISTVSAPPQQGARVIESERVSLDVRPSRDASADADERGTTVVRTPQRGPRTLRSSCHGPVDARVPSRMATVAARPVDLRRALERARPGRQRGRLEPAAAARA